MSDAEIIKELENKVRGSDWGGYDDEDLLDLINRQKAEITALQMENGLLQSNVILATQNYEHIKEKWCESREVIYRQTDRFLNTYKELQAAKAEIERLNALLLDAWTEKVVLQMKHNNIKAEAIKEFAERFLSIVQRVDRDDVDELILIRRDLFDSFVKKEMAGDTE